MSFREYLSDVPMELLDRAELALAYHGIKPASVVAYRGFERDGMQEEETYIIPEGFDGQVCADFARLGVHGVPLERISPQAFGSVSYGALNAGVASDEETLERLNEIYAEYSKAPLPYRDRLASPEAKKKFGLILGFPESAVEAYAKGTAIGAKESQEAIEKELGAEVAAYATFRCSEKWKEEADIARRWACFVKERYPELHRALVRQHILDRQKASPTG
jgi:hypothetical protein